MDDLAGRSTVAATWSALQSLVARGMAIPVFLILARNLSPSDFGVVAIALAIIAVAQMILDQGVSAALIQRKVLNPGHCNAAFWTNVAVGSVLVLSLVALSVSLSDFFGISDLRAPLCVLSVTLLFEAFGLVPVALLTRDLELKSLAIRSTVAGLLAGAAAIAAALGGAGLWALVIQQVVYSVAGLVMVWGLTPWRPGLRCDWKSLKELAPIGVPVFGTNVLITVYRRADDLIIGKALGAASLGFYTIAYRLLQMLNDTLLGTLSRVTLPAFSRTQDDRERLERGRLRATALSSMIAFPAFTALAVLGPELVAILFGNQWHESGRVLAVLAPAGIAQTLAYLYSDVLLAIGRSVLQFWLWALRTILHVAGFLIGSHWGILAVAASFTITSWMILPIDLAVLRRVTGIKLTRYWSSFEAQLLGSAALAAVVLGFRAVFPGAGDWVTVLVAGSLGLTVCFSVIALRNADAIRDLTAILRRRGARPSQDIDSTTKGESV